MSSEGSAPSPPAGWYPDANQHGVMRYWDGTGWTERTHSSVPVAAAATAAAWSAPPSGPSSAPSSALPDWGQPSGWQQQPTGWPQPTGWQQPAGWQQAAAAPLSAGAAASLPLGVAKGIQVTLAIQAVGFALLTIAGLNYYAAGTDFLDSPSVPNADVFIDAEDAYITGWGFQLLLGIATFVLLVVWSYKGTKWAQSQGAELRHGPGWAIGGWFVPIAALFIPFQVLNDLHRYSDPSLPRPIRSLHRRRPGSSHLWGWYLAAVAAAILMQWSSTLFDLTDTEADVRLGLALRVIAPVASALSVGMLLIYIRTTVRRFERSQHNVTGVATPYTFSGQV